MDRSETCRHVIRAYMMLSEVKESCPKKMKLGAGPNQYYMVDKKKCQGCNHYEKKPEGEE